MKRSAQQVIVERRVFRRGGVFIIPPYLLKDLEPFHHRIDEKDVLIIACIRKDILRARPKDYRSDRERGRDGTFTAGSDDGCANDDGNV